MGKRLKLVGLVFLTTLIAIAGWYAAQSKPIEVPLSLSSNLFSIVNLTLEGHAYPFNFALESRHPLTIDEQLLSTLRKQAKGTGDSFDLDGAETTSPLYSLPKAFLGQIALHNTITAPHKHLSAAGEPVGSVAWPLETMNVVVDLPHRKLVGVRSKKDLAKAGYDLRKMTKVKYHTTRGGLRFQIDTSMGPMLATLSPGVNINIIKSTQTPQSPRAEITATVGDREFTSLYCTPYPITDKLDFDLILGTEFLQDHIVYVDAKAGYLYIGNEYATGCSYRSPIHVPLELDTNGSPTLNLVMKGKTQRVLFDTGCSSELIFQPEAIDTEPLNCVSTVTSYNVAGEEEKSLQLVLPACSIQGVQLKNLLLKIQGKVGYKTIYTFSQPQGMAKTSGYLGLPFLQRTNIYLDIPNEDMWLVDNPRDLNKINIDLANWNRVPLEIEHSGMVITCETDFGQMRFMIDTGAGLTVVKPEILRHPNTIEDTDGNFHFLTDSFLLNGKNYGSQNLYPFEITSKFGSIDGILGIDFLRKHPCYIDYQNRAIYFQRPL